MIHGFLALIGSCLLFSIWLSKKVNKWCVANVKIHPSEHRIFFIAEKSFIECAKRMSEGDGKGEGEKRGNDGETRMKKRQKNACSTPVAIKERINYPLLPCTRWIRLRFVLRLITVKCNYVGSRILKSHPILPTHATQLSSATTIRQYSILAQFSPVVQSMRLSSWRKGRQTRRA